MEKLRHAQPAGALLSVFLITLPVQAEPLALPVQADPLTTDLRLDILPERLLPEYTPCMHAKVRHACYSLEQMTQLNMLEVRARYWHDQWEDTSAILAAQTAITFNLQDQLALRLDMQRKDQDQILVLHNQLSDETEAKEEWQAKAEGGNAWALWLGGVMAVFGLGAAAVGLIR